MAESKTRNFFVWIIMGLLFIGLVGFGSVGLSGQTRSVGTVGQLPVPVPNYVNALNNQISQISAQFGTRLSFAQADQFGASRQALASVIADRVLDNEMLELGISAGDETVREAVLANPAFRGGDGQFSRERYRLLLRENGLSEGEYETSIREDTVRSLLQGAVVTGVAEPMTYARALAAFNNETRAFTWGSVSEADLVAPLREPSDEDLVTFYDLNADRFTAPEIRVLTYAALTPDMIQDIVEIDEAELRAAYDERFDEFNQPERRLVERLVYSSIEAAEADLARIAAGETDFDTLVSDRGLDLADIDLGDVTEAQMGTAGAAIFAAETGDVVGPFESSLGPALFRMNAILDATETPYEEALPLLREDAAAARARRVIEDQVDPINDLLIGGARLEDLVELTELQLGTLEWTADSTDGIAAYEGFREAAAAASEGAFPELLTLEDGGIFALRVDEIRAPALRPFDEVREDVAEAWASAQTRARVVDLATTLSTQITPETEFGSLGITDAIAETGITRRSFLGGTPPTFIPQVFDLAAGDVAVVEDADKVIIVRLDAITPADLTSDAASDEISSIAANASEAIAFDIFAYFSASVQAETDIQINQQAINAIHAQFQ